MTQLHLDPSMLGMHVSGDLADVTIYQTKRGKIVAFPKSPPKRPPTSAQLLQRSRFRRAMSAWSLLTRQEQAAYDQVTRTLSICMTGANLFVHLSLCFRPGLFQTLQDQASQQLTPPPHY